MTPVTLCGKCGNAVEKCTCAEIVVAQPPQPPRIPETFGNLVTDDIPAFKQAMRNELKKTRVAPDDKRELYPVCKAIGNTFGCLKCSGPARIKW